MNSNGLIVSIRDQQNQNQPKHILTILTCSKGTLSCQCTGAEWAAQLLPLSECSKERVYGGNV